MCIVRQWPLWVKTRPARVRKVSCNSEEYVQISPVWANPKTAWTTIESMKAWDANPVMVPAKTHSKPDESQYRGLGKVA